MADRNDHPAEGRPTRFGLALLAGGGVMLAGAIAWALYEYTENRLYAPLPLVMGLVVGFAVERARPGDVRGPLSSAVLAVVGCALGPFLLVMLEPVLRAHATLTAVLGHPADLITAYRYAVGGGFGIFGFLAWPVAAFLAFILPFLHSAVARRAARDGGASR